MVVVALALLLVPVVAAVVGVAWNEWTELFWLRARLSDVSEGSLWLDSVDDRDSTDAIGLTTFS